MISVLEEQFVNSSLFNELDARHDCLCDRTGFLFETERPYLQNQMEII